MRVSLESEQEALCFEIEYNKVLYRVKRWWKKRYSQDYANVEYEIVRELSSEERSNVIKIIEARLEDK
jgi:hypothetical protein